MLKLPSESVIPVTHQGESLLFNRYTFLLVMKLFVLLALFLNKILSF